MKRENKCKYTSFSTWLLPADCDLLISAHAATCLSDRLLLWRPRQIGQGLNLLWLTPILRWLRRWQIWYCTAHAWLIALVTWSWRYRWWLRRRDSSLAYRLSRDSRAWCHACRRQIQSTIVLVESQIIWGLRQIFVALIVGQLRWWSL